jgi:hypothetical protein
MVPAKERIMIRTTISTILLAGVLASCAHSDPAPTTPDSPAASAGDVFWTAFLAQRYDQLPAVIDGLAAEAAARPDDPWAAELHAIAIVWQISEASRNPSQDPKQIPMLALTAEQSLLRANQLAPTDPLILGRLGSLEVAIGGVLHDSDRIARGIAAIDEGVRQYPEFALFGRARLLFDLPPGAPSAAARFDDFWSKLDACAGEPVDRLAFDLGKYVAQATATGAKRVCWNTEHTPHGVEGFFLYMGDALLRRGDAATARAIYANARNSPDYPSWPFRALLDDRIASADAWAARLTDADPENDPVLINAAPVACASCHAAR